MKTNQKGFAPIIVLILVVVLAVGAYYFISTKKKVSVQPQPISSITTDANTSAQVSSPTAGTTTTKTTATSTSDTKNCGTNMDCFITQVNTCGPATIGGNLAFGPATITANLSVKKTATANVCSFTESAYGTKSVCSIPSDKLVSLLNDFKQGNSSSNDMNNYNCTITASDGTSLNTTPTSSGSAVATHGYTYSEWGSVGASMSNSAFSYKVLAIDTNSMTFSFTNNQTNQSTTLTLQKNAPVVFAKYTITFTGVGPDGATFTIKE